MSAAVIEAPFGDAESRDLLAFDSSPWEGLDLTSIALTPTPLESQPSSYVQVSWGNRKRGNVAGVDVKALYTGDDIAISLRWHQPVPSRSINDYNAFADGCAVLFPDDGKHADIATMGSAAAPVAGWYWRAGMAEPFEISAHGIGTVERSNEHNLRSAARWSDDYWHVVLMRNLDLPHPKLRGVFEVPVAFAIWCGAQDERAGLKSYSPAFASLRLIGG